MSCNDFSGKEAAVSKKIFLVLLSLSMATPASAGGRDHYQAGYNAGSYNSYRRHSEHRDHSRARNGGGTAVALIGGVILGVALASSNRAKQRDVVYVERDYQPRCYDRQVTEQTVSGRYVTYTERTCE